MNQLRECGCKGRRTCLWCEENYKLQPDFTLSAEMRSKSYVYCPQCDAAWPGWDMNIASQHPNHTGAKISFRGILVQEDFLSPDEADTLIHNMDTDPWDISQSGRRKQNFGPKCNFKKKKISAGNFNGFPGYSVFIQKKFEHVELLKNYYTIEQCSLEYTPEKGACIDPHIDDCWIWGERIITVNIIGDSVLTLMPYRGDEKKYNLDLVPDFFPTPLPPEDIVVRVPMPARSLLVMYGDARYGWEHFILREDVEERRVCIAYREFTPPYLPGGDKANNGEEILEISKKSAAQGFEQG